MRSEILLVSFIDEEELKGFLVNETNVLMEATNTAVKLLHATGSKYASDVDMAAGADGSKLRLSIYIY